MNKNWKLRRELTKEKVEDISKKLGLPEITAQILLSRGYDTEEKINDFLDTSISKIDNPFKMNDMQKTIDRIEKALENEEKIIIYGDYDSDGLTSTSIMKEAIEIIGGQVDTYIPDRFIDGYGPNIDAYKKIIANGYDLIITVDNGVSGKEAIDFANENHVDVIITDHHTLPEQLPDAVAIVHPRIPGSEYSCPNLSGAGVAFKVASALLQEVPLDLMDLAAIGTISDVVELKGENRAIVANGLKQIETQNRMGLNALLKVSKVKPENISEEDVGFQIAPRLNALGRIKNANIGVELLTSQDNDSVSKISKEVDEINNLRKTYSNEVYEQALMQLKNKNLQFQVLYSDDWNEGVLGIVAGKISSETNKPTLILTKHEDVYKGSGRSPIGFNLYDAMIKYKDFYMSFGGHAQACGVSIKDDKINEFIDLIQAELNEQKFDSNQDEICEYDLEIQTKEITFGLLDQINKLAPFGEGNPKPIFKTSNVEIVDEKSIGSDKTHLKGKISQNNHTIDFIAFNFSNNFEMIKNIPLYNTYYQVGTNEWKGQKKIQLIINDIQSDSFASKFIDCRGNSFDIKSLDENTSIIFFNRRYHSLFVQKNNDVKGYMWNDPLVSKLKNILIFDRPHEITKFEQFLKIQNAQKIYLLFYSQLKYSYDLIPDKKEMHDALKYVLKHSGISEDNYETIAKYLNININNLKFYIRVFFELDFVKIENGVLVPQHIDKNRKLDSSLFYKKRLKRNEVGALLVNSDYSDLLSWIENQ